MNHSRIKCSILVVDFLRNADLCVRLESTFFPLEPDSVPVSEVVEEPVCFFARMDDEIDALGWQLTVSVFEL